MNVKTIKLLIVFFAGLILIFIALMAVNNFNNGGSGESAEGGSEATRYSDQFSARAAAQRVLAEAAAAGETRENAPPAYEAAAPTAAVKSEGAIMLVKNREFGGVAEDPKSMMDMLTEMSGSNKKKIPPIHLTDADLGKKVAVPSPRTTARRTGGSSAVPGLGSPAEGTQALITAPVDFQLYKSSETWHTFARSHKGRFPSIDFSKEQMVILVSVSNLPSGIFRIAGLKVTKKETIVLYRVDPLAMSAENGAKERDHYTAAAVPRNLPVRLEQVP